MAAALTSETPDTIEAGPRKRRRQVLRRAADARTAPAATPPPTPTTTQEATGPTTARLVAGTLVLLGALVAGFVGYLVVGASLQADRAQDVLYEQLRDDLGAMTVPYAGVIAPGTAVGVLSVPRIGLDQVIVEGSSSEETRTGPGLKPDTVLPGQAGLSVLVGHRSTSGAAFGRLDELTVGDTLEVKTGQGTFRYVVDLVRTSDAPQTQVEVVPARLTLVTSDPAFTPYRQLVVSARLDGDALPTTTGQAAGTIDQPGEGTSSGLVSLLLWSQVLLVASVLVTWAAIRFPGRGLWIGATPVLLAILWQVYEDLALLLPNTL